MVQTALKLEPPRAVLRTAAALGAVTGVRSMAAPALLAHEFSAHGADPSSPIGRFLGSDGSARVLAMFAGGEMIADKMPLIPDRTDLGPLLGRAAIGAFSAAAYAASRKQKVLMPAIAGAAGAVAAAFAAFHLRRFVTEELGAPDRAIGLMEDAIVVVAARAIRRRFG